MAFARTFSVALVGIKGHIVEVEADISQALPGFVLLGLPDTSLSEAKDRVRSAAKNSGLPLPQRKLTINLTPATLPKRGSAFDVAMVMAALQAAGNIKVPASTLFLGELGLDGSLRPIVGVLPAVHTAVSAGFQRIIVPEQNAAEASLVPGAQVLGFSCLAQVLLSCGAEEKDLKYPSQPSQNPSLQQEELQVFEKDMADVAGQTEGRFALEIAAAGGHHIIFKGSPGSGKTMLAERLCSILPALDDQAAMEVTAIHSLCSGGAQRRQLIRLPPFEAPHHSASAPAILGGGSGIPRPGAISRAHRGVLFLDEAPEFKRHVLDALRQPLETGTILIDRSAASAQYPASFQLVLAANPCLCGMNIGRGLECTCSVQQRRNYAARLSGPLLDRIDLQVIVPHITGRELGQEQVNEASSNIRKRVIAARAAQKERLAPFGIKNNAQAQGSILRGPLKLSQELTSQLNKALDAGWLTARGYDRVLRTAWTLADLEGASSPQKQHIDLALYFRDMAQGKN